MRLGANCPLDGCGRLLTVDATFSPFYRQRNYRGHLRQVHLLSPREAYDLAVTMRATEREVVAHASMRGGRQLIPRSVREKRYCTGLTNRVRALYGGFCYGCGANGGTPLENAHRLPTGLDGMGRGKKARLMDVLNNPFAYLPLCKPCHRAFGGPERWER